MQLSEADIQSIMLETTMSARKLLNRLLDKQSISSEEKHAAEIALTFLELTSQSAIGY